MLEVEGLEVYYGPIRALRGVSLKVDTKETVTILGANGAGKTTTLRAIMGLVPAAAGTVRFLGKKINGLPVSSLVRKGLVMVPEGRRVFPRLSVLDNLLLGAYTRQKSEYRADLEWVFSLFPRLAERKNQLAGTLSGGEQQMLAIGRGLMARPRLLLLDEPSMGLSPILVKQIFSTIEEIRRQGTTILLVEQNARQALRVSQRGYVLENGLITTSGRAEELKEMEHIKKAYLGQ